MDYQKETNKKIIKSLATDRKRREGEEKDVSSYRMNLREKNTGNWKIIIIIITIIYLLTAIGLSPCGSGYFTCKQNMKSVTTEFKSGGLHEKHAVTTWNVGNRLSVCL